ncbi:MAG: ankyrin repeat domain-containing protein [Saprospiraceae bacterium]|nr:ankyrin repeat domain-containing protein [Saprospiraceae bacterium]
MVNLFEAIIHKNTKKVKYTLEQGANPNSIIDASGLSAMHFACQSTASIFEYLLEVGGSIFNRDSDGVSVIECASNNPKIHRLIRKKCVIYGSID